MAGQLQNAVWMNKRAGAVIEINPPHTFRPNPDGWEVQVSGEGVLVGKLVHGGEQRIPVQSGDLLRANGEEMYLTIAPR